MNYMDDQLQVKMANNANFWHNSIVLNSKSNPALHVLCFITHGILCPVILYITQGIVIARLRRCWPFTPLFCGCFMIRPSGTHIDLAYKCNLMFLLHNIWFFFLYNWPLNIGASSNKQKVNKSSEKEKKLKTNVIKKCQN